ncbi:MAG TPA: ADP-ribosylglycohydrolase family protein [Deferrisomatales bacterium]|nr:ADP-ribosylglycohydrolase family protein [Deferrisomatales bacterium]
MLGAIAGDVIGSVFEWHNAKTTEFPLLSPDSTFTDDSVLTVATAAAILERPAAPDYAAAYRDHFRRYPDVGYGPRFRRWAATQGAPPYRSYGNGSAMRVSPVAYAWDDVTTVLEAARASAAVTHDHPEGIRGAQATALAVLLARQGAGKVRICEEIEVRFGYDLGTPLGAIRPSYAFDVTCQGSVPQALRAFLEAEGFEEAVRLAISIGGDSDTIACIAGAVAEAFFGGVPEAIRDPVIARLPPHLVLVATEFRERFPCPV